MDYLAAFYAASSNMTTTTSSPTMNTTTTSWPTLDPTMMPSNIPTTTPSNVPTMVPTDTPTSGVPRRRFQDAMNFNSTLNWNITWNWDIFANLTMEDLFGCTLVNDSDATYCVSDSFCTGSLVQLEFPVTILTAAHCLHSNETVPASVYGVYLGRTDVDGDYNSSTNDYSYHAVWKYDVHPDYDPYGLQNDIVLMYLYAALSDDDRLEAVDLNDEPLESWEELRVIGYGLNGSNGSVT